MCYGYTVTVELLLFDPKAHITEVFESNLHEMHDKFTYSLCDGDGDARNVIFFIDDECSARTHSEA